MHRGRRHDIAGSGFRCSRRFTALREGWSLQRPSENQVEGDDKRQNLPEHCRGHGFRTITSAED